MHGAAGTAIDLATTGTRPTTAPSGPGGASRCQQASRSPWPTVRQPARGASWTAGPGRSPTSEMAFNDVIEKTGMAIDAAGVVVIVTGAALAFVIAAVRLSPLC